MLQFGKENERYGSWEGDIRLTVSNTDPDFIKEFIDNEVASWYKNDVKEAINNGEDFSISCLSSSSSTADFVKDNIINEYNTSSIGYDVNYQLDVRCTLDGDEVDWDYLLADSQEEIFNKIMNDYLNGEFTESSWHEYEVEVSGINYENVDSKGYLVGSVVISNDSWEKEYCNFEYDIDSDEIEIIQHSNPGYMTGAVYETELAEMVRDNISEIHSEVYDKVEGFFTDTMIDIQDIVGDLAEFEIDYDEQIINFTINDDVYLAAPLAFDKNNNINLNVIQDCIDTALEEPELSDYQLEVLNDFKEDFDKRINEVLLDSLEDKLKAAEEKAASQEISDNKEKSKDELAM